MKALRLVIGIFFAVIVATSVFGAAQNEPMVQVTVKSRDYLIRICEKYLENPMQWGKIAQINHLKNPDLIYPGQTILIPASFLKGTPARGTVSFAKGDVSFRTLDKEEWRPLALNDQVEEGYMIKTGNESSVEIKFEDGNSFLLKSNTTVGLTTARKGGDNYSKYKLSLRLGKVISNIQKSTGRESAVQIEAPTAVAGVRGTIFRSSVGSDNTSQFEVLEGAVFVEGKNKTVEVKQGEGTVVREGESPTDPSKLLPPPALVQLSPVYKKFPIRLTFEKVQDAVSYRVVLAKDRDVKDVVKERIIGPQDTFEITEIADGTYFLQSSSIDNLGLEGLPSDAIEIRIRVNPAAPFIKLPADKAEYKLQSLKCEWLKVSDAAKYYVQIAEDNEFQQLVRDRNDLGNPEYATGNLEFKTYYFRVGSIAADNYQGEWSDTLTFTLLPPPPAPPVEKPEMDKKEIRIRWQDLGKEITYHFQMSKSEEFKEVLIDQVLERPEITFAKPKQAGIYYVRTCGIDSGGREGNFSKPQSFEIKRNNSPLGCVITGAAGLLFYFLAN